MGQVNAFKLALGCLLCSILTTNGFAASHNWNTKKHNHKGTVRTRQPSGAVFELHRGQGKVRTNNYYPISQRELRERIVKTPPLLSKGL